MPAPNLFLIYVTDIARSTAFYGELFEIEPAFESPRFVSFEVAPGVNFSLFGGSPEHAHPQTPRTSEVGLMVPPDSQAVDELFERWVGQGATVVEAPHDEVFGHTFLVADPDGNLIRVAPID